MKKVLPLFLIFGLLVSFGCMKKAADSAAVAVDVGVTMVKIGAEYGALKQAYAAKKFADCEKSFNTLSDLFKTLKTVTPKVGTKTEWDAIHVTCIATCKAGVLAAKFKQEAVVGSSIEALKTSMIAGHKAFKK